MSDPSPTWEAAYRIAGQPVSILDLLGRFAEPKYQSHGVSRLSDLHLKVGEPARYRHDEAVVPVPEGERLSEDVLRHLLFPLLSEEAITRLTGAPPQDVDASFDLAEKGLSFRINAFHDREGLACAIRALPRSIPKVEDLGFPSDRVWREIVKKKRGLVIATGITGSGKSTTLASLIQHINAHRELRIITLEDPIEYVIPSERSLVSQRELGRHVRSFSDGLRSALREDPDIILVGEIRDHETCALALSAAETGHLVLSTLHTKDARGAITRIVDLFPSDRSGELSTQLSFSLSFILGQKLIPRADGSGRRLVMEVLKNVAPIANQIRSGKLHQIYSTMQTLKKDGVNTLEDHLLDLVNAGEVRREDALRLANDAQSLEALL